MTFRVNMYIAGMCLVVPITNRREELTEVQVLFPDARQPNRNGVTPHQPMLQYALKNKRSHGPRFPLFLDAFDELQGLLLLSDHDWSWATAEGPVTSVPNFKCSPEEKLGNVPNADTAADLGWLVRVLDADGRTGLVKRGLCLPDLDRNLAKRHLSSRIRFQTGHWRTASFSRSQETNQFVQWQVGSVQRAAANLVKVSMNVPGETLVMSGRGFNGGDAESLILGPSREEPDAPVELWIMNREMELVVHQYFSRSLNLAEAHQEESFRYFYDLLETPPTRVTSLLPTTRNLLGEVTPDCLIPCGNRGMKRLYFPDYEGQTGPSANSCFPGTGQSGPIP